MNFLRGDFSLTAFVLLALSTALLMFLAREPAHRFIDRFMYALARVCRYLARCCLATAATLKLFNENAFLSIRVARAKQAAAMNLPDLQTRFDEELQGHKQLQVSLERIVSELQQEYDSARIDASPSEYWDQMRNKIDALDYAELNHDILAKEIAALKDILSKQQTESMREYRWALATRHKQLASLRPRWRKMMSKHENLVSALEKLVLSAARIEGYYKELNRTSTIQKLSSDPEKNDNLFVWAVPKFILASLLLAVCGIAGYVNIYLLHAGFDQLLLPVGQLPALTSLWLAICHTSLMVVFSLVLFDSRLLNQLVGSLIADRQGQRKLAVGISFMMLALLAVGEIVLVSTMTNGLITEFAQTTLFIPLLAIPTMVLLSLSAIALDSLSMTIPLIVSLVMQCVLTLLGLMLRQCTMISREVSKLLLLAYDLVIFLPLGVRHYFQQKQFADDSSEPSMTASIDQDDSNVAAFSRDRKQR